MLQNIRKVLKPSGYVLFRDYATGDLAQERLTCKDQKISENFYVRGDGTRAFYFSNEFLTSMFKENGFDVEELGLCCKQVENRSRELVMNRRWVQAVFRISDGNLSTKTEASIQVKEKMLKDAVDNVEVDMSDSFAAEIFGSSASDENETIKLGDLNFDIKRLSKEYQHTCKSTGLMIWESARLMASVLARNPTIVSGKRVLELGCGCSGICSMVAAKHADLVIATDGDTKALDLLTQNVTLNLAPPFLDKLLVRKLEWGNRDHIEAIKEVNNRGFDIIIGTDVTYVSAAISPLFATAKELISSNGGISKGIEPGLILCHIIRRVDEPSMLSTAVKFGFRLVDNWPSGISSGPSENIINSWFPENGPENLPSTALNILYFRME